MNFESIRIWVKTYIQPLGRGKFNQTIKDNVKMEDLLPKGTRDNFTNASPYGIVSKTPKKVFGYFLNFLGFHDSPIIIAHLDQMKPAPSKDGEVIFYCRKPDGTTFPVKMTFDPDGELKLETSENVTIITKNVTVQCDDATINSKNTNINAENAIITATTKIQHKSDNVEVGNGPHEKVLNGESTFASFNAHLHTDIFGLPTSAPINPLVTETHLSNKVKAGK